MGLLARIFGAVPRSERPGLSLNEASPWEIEATRDRGSFLRALPQLVPDGSVVYFEGTTETEIEQFLERNRAPHPPKIAIGTIWPRPKTFHLRCETEVLLLLAQLVESPRNAYLCTHVHAYKGEKVLLEWHDAFDTDPMLVSRTIDETAVSAFANALGSRYAGSQNDG